MKRFLVSYNDALGTHQVDFNHSEKRAWRYFNAIARNPRPTVTIAEIAVQYEEEDDWYEVLARFDPNPNNPGFDYVNEKQWWNRKLKFAAMMTAID